LLDQLTFLSLIDRLVVKITLNHLFLESTCITLVDWLKVKITFIFIDRFVVKVNLNDLSVINISENKNKKLRSVYSTCK